MSSRKKPHNKLQGKNTNNDIEKNKQENYLRNCVNCLKRNDCNKIPQKNSIKRHSEWCESFLPNYRRIDRMRANQAFNTIINPNSPAGQRAGIQATGELLKKVEDALNVLGKHDGEVV